MVTDESNYIEEESRLRNSAAKFPNICRACCIRVQLNSETTGLHTKEHFLNLYSSNPVVPSAFVFLSKDVLTVDKLRTLPCNTCYLCAGILQCATLTALVEQGQALLADFEGYVGVGVTCSSLALLQTRSYLCDIGKLNLDVKSVFKWLMAERLAENGLHYVAKPADDDIILNVEVQLDNEEFMWMCRDPVCWNVYNFVQARFKVAPLENALAKSTYSDIKQYRNIPGKAIQFRISVETSHIFLGGRYTKNARDISQTPWFNRDGDHIIGNVEDIISKPLKDATGATDIKMHASGREDIDVRMLGDGRPFYIQMNNARRCPSQAALDKIQLEINATSPFVKCHKLTRITRAQSELVKIGQEEKEKEYRCIIKAENVVISSMIDTLNGVKNLFLEQKTPIRVLHRRTPITRKKKIVSVSARVLTPEEVTTATQKDPSLRDHLDGRLFVAYITSEAGTYIKEFVHGDFGRTHPNIGTLIGNRCDMLQLDVVNVGGMIWPPPPVTKDESKCNT